jgi:two-component system, cell cycle sensor histidine kinase and response regulator CckA
MSTLRHTQRILVIDDNPAIHEDFRKVLGGLPPNEPSFVEAKARLFDEAPKPAHALEFEIDSAFQGQEGLAMVEQSIQQGRPYALAFVDVRMPPGWDGVETISHIWRKYPELQVVLCTAYSDYSWEDIIKHLGQSDSMLILKKPFDNVEVLQLAHSLTKKWRLTQQARIRMEDLDRLVNERTRELRISEERFSKAFECSPLPMTIQTLRDQRFLDVNNSFLQLSGYAREEMLNQTPAELAIWVDAKSEAGFVGRVLENKSIRNLRSQFRTKSGQVRETLVFAELFNLETEPCFLTLTEDISERLNLESQLRQAHKMEAIGQLAAGVAHDFNNILTVIQGHVSLVLSGNKVDQQDEASLKQTLAASERAGNLTRQLLAFSRKQIMECKPVKLDRLFDQLGPMLQRLIGEQIQIEFHSPPLLPPIHADLCNIEQVLMNLAVNARDAMPQGGRLTISATGLHISQSDTNANPEAYVGQFVCLSVSDTGCGMDDATKSLIFEPFFTTKEVGKGTGMGLATVYGIVKQHKGWIELDSRVGCGTTFRVYLPESVELCDATLPAKPETPPSSLEGDETILIVEDEPFLRKFVQTVLGTYGYKVLLAADAAQALEVWRQQKNDIALLLTDMVMPGGINGKELAEILRAQSPGLKVIFTSGYSLDVLGDNYRLTVGSDLLQKPYSASVLVAAVRQCLDTEGAHGVLNNRWPMAGNL